MAPGLVYPQPHDELQDRHQLKAASRDERAAAASSTALPSSSQASPALHAVEMDAPRPSASSTVEQPIEGADMGLLVEKLTKTIEYQTKTIERQNEQARQLDDLIGTVQALPRLSRAFSEGSLPSSTATTGSSLQTPPEGATALKSPARYQATVEDCTESEAEEDIPTPASGGTVSPAPTRQSKPDQDRPLPRRHHTFSASAPTSPSAAHVVATETPAPVVVPVIKEVRFSDRAPSVLQRSASARYLSGTSSSSSQQPQARSYQPQPRERVGTSLQDERWGTLFTPQGKATSRMREVLRGLASHLIEVYKPAYSLVITPEKLFKFYSRYGLDREHIDLVRIFGLTSMAAMGRLETLFVHLNCDFHVVQDNYGPGGRLRRPYIPALTPEGFVQWSITLIRACPDQEAARLARVFADISFEARPEDPSLLESDDGQRTRRLPRQISRYLFPAEPNTSELRLLTDTVREWKHATASSSASRSPDRPPPPPPPPSAQPIMQSKGHQQQPPLIHSDARSRQEHLHRCRRDYERDAPALMVPHGGSKRSSGEDREYRSSGPSSRYAKPPHVSRGESPRRSSKRYDRRDSKESERDRRRGDRRWSTDSYDEARYRRRDTRGPRA